MRALFLIKKKGFTLLELLVVISIIGMLSTVILASTNTARAKSRDAKRSQQVHQIDVAVQLYKSNHGGKAPDLQGTCAALSNPGSGGPSDAAASACFAVSTGGVVWENFKKDIEPYMPSVPADPCPTCTSGSSFPLGYTYVAPLAMQHACYQQGSCSQSPEVIDQTYQLYAAQEKAPGPTGVSSGGTFVPVVAPASGGSGITFKISPLWVGDARSASYVVSGASSCNLTGEPFDLVSGYIGPAPLSNVITPPWDPEVEGQVVYITLSCVGPGGSASQSFYISL